jgi:cohesin complex subunit SCC1
MREDYGSLPMNMHDDGFGDLDSPDLVRDEASANIDDDLFSDPMHQTTTLDNTKEPGTSRSLLDSHPIDDDFGEDFGESANLFGGDIFGDTAAADESQITNQGNMTSRSDDSDDDVGHFDGASPALSSTSSRPPSTIPPLNINRFDSTNPQDNSYMAVLNQPEVKDEPLPTNDEESFALAPIDATALKGVTKPKRKRKLIIDEVKNISGEEMKAQLANTADIITSLDLAPPTKKLMNWKETGGVEKLFALPSRLLPARALSKIYQINLLSTSALSEDFSILGPPDILALDQSTLSVLTDTPTKRGRKRKNNEHDTNDTNDLPDPIRDIHEFPPHTPIELKGKILIGMQIFHIKF